MVPWESLNDFRGGSGNIIQESIYLRKIFGLIGVIATTFCEQPKQLFGLSLFEEEELQHQKIRDICGINQSYTSDFGCNFKEFSKYPQQALDYKPQEVSRK